MLDSWHFTFATSESLSKTMCTAPWFICGSKYSVSEFSKLVWLFSLRILISICEFRDSVMSQSFLCKCEGCTIHVEPRFTGNRCILTECKLEGKISLSGLHTHSLRHTSNVTSSVKSSLTFLRYHLLLIFLGFHSLVCITHYNIYHFTVGLLYKTYLLKNRLFSLALYP